MRQYCEEPEPVQHRRKVETEQGQPDSHRRTSDELQLSQCGGGDVSSGVEEPRWSMERLNAPGRFYAVAKGTKPGLFQSWFAAGNQVLNVPGSMQERFSSRLEALHFIISYFQAVGCGDDVVEYDECVQEVCRYRQSQ